MGQMESKMSPVCSQSRTSEFCQFYRTQISPAGGGGDTQGNCVGESLVVLGMKQENQSSVYFLVEYQALCILGGRGVKEGFAIKF